MLSELHVRDLGVFAELTLLLPDGMTALTGETGAGKTLLVEAIELLMGGRADPVLVRPGSAEARVEGRFAAADGAEVVLARAVPRDGRSRAYVDGRLATAAELAEVGRSLVDLHGQHAHQSLLATRAQRAALDRFGDVDLGRLEAARVRLAAVDRSLAALGGDSRARAREIDLLRFQVAELTQAGLDDPDEDERLEAEEDVLADAAAFRQAGLDAHHALAGDGDGGAGDGVGRALAAIAGRLPYADVEARLRMAAAEIDEAAADLRRMAEAMVEQPERVEEVRARRRLLRELCRKYGERLSDVIAYEVEARARLDELESHAQRVQELEEERARAVAAVDDAARAVGRARRQAAPLLAAAIEGHLRVLGMARACFAVAVDGPDPGDGVEFLLGANAGEPALPLAKVASGGELARAMLAARLVLTDAPPTLVFDEVDAGVGGEAALAVGRALAALADRGQGPSGPLSGKQGPSGPLSGRQVLVVTHLPQVAAFADSQVAVTKEERDGRTVGAARPVTGHERVVELSRMLSGQPASTAARGHAEELLATASRERGRP